MEKINTYNKGTESDPRTADDAVLRSMDGEKKKFGIHWFKLTYQLHKHSLTPNLELQLFLMATHMNVLVVILQLIHVLCGMHFQ